MRCRLVATMMLACVGLILAGHALAQDAKLIEGARVVGNDYIPQEGILDEVKDILKPGETFDEQRSKAAKDALMAMGYFDSVELSTEASPKGVTVVITVVEKQRVQRILFVGNTVVDDASMTDVIYTRVGHVVDDRTIRRDVRRIEDFYAQKGFIAHVAKASVGQFGVLTFVIEEARIEDIVVEGLKRTKEEVVRRELTIKAGGLFEEGKIARDIQRLFNLGIFDNVTSDIRPGVKDPQRGVIVVIVIKEKRTGQASVAAGYSSLDNFVLVLSVAENNFRGRGERASLNLELFGRTSYEASFFEPYVDKHGTSFNIRLYDTERNRQFVGGTIVSTNADRFEERRSGVTFSVSRPRGVAERLSLRFRSEQVSSSAAQGTRYLNPTIGTSQVGTSQFSGGTTTPYYPGTGRDYEQSPPDNPDLNPDDPEPGEVLGPVLVAAPLHPGGTLASLTLGWTRDTRNLLANPTKGSYLSLSAEQAGSYIGGDTTFTKLTAEHRYVYKLGNRKDVIATRLMGGIAIGDLPLFESYSVGGANTLRGYQEDRFRGEKMILGNVELRHPINDNLTAVLFVDGGDAFGGVFPTVVPGFSIPAEDTSFKFHVGYGAGLRIVTPVGPVRLDVGRGEYGTETHFNFGHTF